MSVLLCVYLCVYMFYRECVWWNGVTEVVLFVLANLISEVESG